MLLALGTHRQFCVSASCLLPEFADLLGLRARKITFSEKRVIPKDEARVRAGIARWSRPLEGFLDLWKVREHFGERVRHSAVYIYALLLRRNRVCISDIVKRCESLGRACVPPLSAAVKPQGCLG